MKPWTPTNTSGVPPATGGIGSTTKLMPASVKPPTAHGPVIANGAVPLENDSFMMS